MTEERRALPIAMFDSGVGGLTVLHECLVSLPEEDFVYLGDSARFPYGTKTRDELESCAEANTRFLLDRGAKLVVIACNSATAAALPALRTRMFQTTLGVDVLGVVRPEAVQAVTATRNGRIGLLATPSTVASRAYDEAIAAADPHVDLISVACPDLAPLIQGGMDVDERMVDVVRGYCAPLREARVDTVILGCTHYPLIRPLLQRILGRGVATITSGAALARQAEHALGSRGLDNPREGEGDYWFLCTGDAQAFRALGTRFLQMPLGEVVQVPLGEPALAGRPEAGLP
jgi:glutamate racemase